MFEVIEYLTLTTYLFDTFSDSIKFVQDNIGNELILESFGDKDNIRFCVYSVYDKDKADEDKDIFTICQKLIP